MAASKRCIFLAGAPESASLRWDEEILVHGFDRPVHRFLEGYERHSPLRENATSSVPEAKWRSVTLIGEQPAKRNDCVVSAALESKYKRQLNGTDGAEEVEFLEHSLAFLDDLDTSQIVTVTALDKANADPGGQTTLLSLSTDDVTETSFETSLNDSFATTTDSPSQRSPSKRSPVKSVSSTGPVSNLKQIPSADYITAIHPQTITVNLIVGIISVSQTRTVRLRRRKGEMDIIELTVGDETRAGFKVNFWLLPADSQHHPTDDLRGNISGLLTGDIVMFQNVALSCFRGNVHGQSLGRRFAKNSTTVTLLAEKEVSSSLGDKVERVREWTSNFVGVASKSGTGMRSFDEHVGEGKRRRTEDLLPPDTQD